MFQRSRVWTPALLTEWTFFTYIFCCKNCNDVSLKRTKMNDKWGRGWLIFFKKNSASLWDLAFRHYQSIFGDLTYSDHPRAEVSFLKNVFVYFQTQILQKITVCVSGIRTRIVGVEGEHADHLTSTTAGLGKVRCRLRWGQVQAKVKLVLN